MPPRSSQPAPFQGNDRYHLRRRKKTKALAKKPWAFLAYIAGDNDLSDYGLEDIFEMCETGASPKLHAAVEIDTRGDHTGSIRYEISEPDATGEAHPVEIERLPEMDSGAPKTLHGFLDWGLGRYAADKRLVVIWNHGAGFRTVDRDIAFDDYGSSLDMNEIESVLRQAGFGGENRIQVLGFDACLMNMLEVVHHLRGLVDVVVGSEQIEPGDGWPYEAVLQVMHGNPSPAQLSQQIVQSYIADYQARGDRNVTQSAIAVDATDKAAAALGKLGQALAGSLAAIGASLQPIRTEVQSYRFADYVDLVHLAQLIDANINDPAIRTHSRAVIQATNAAVLANGRFGEEVDHSNGLSVWLPAERGLFLAHRSKYRALHCSTAHPGWLQFLDAYHSQ